MKKVDMPLKYIRLCHRIFFVVAVTWMMVLWINAMQSVNSKYEQLRWEKVIVDTKPVEYLTDYELSKLYSYKEEETNDTCVVLSVEDAELLMRIAKAEDGTSAESQAYIMSVILNRVNSPDFPDTVKEVIEQEGQFNATYKTPDVNSHLALAMVESGEIKTDALYFEATWLKGSWQSKHKQYICTVGETKFYR